MRDTTYGRKLTVDIDDFYVTLPPRFSDKINTADQIAELNKQKFRMEYAGKSVDEHNMLKIDFRKESYYNDAQTFGDTDDDVLITGRLRPMQLVRQFAASAVLTTQFLLQRVCTP